MTTRQGGAAKLLVAIGAAACILCGVGLQTQAQQKPACHHGMITAIGIDGLVVVGVGSGSPAERAGILPGERVVGFSSDVAANPLELANRLSPAAVEAACGKELELLVRGAGEARHVKVRVADYANPLSLAPFILPGLPALRSGGLFSPFSPDEWESIRTEAAGRQEPFGPVEVGAAYNRGVSPKNGPASLAPGDGTYKVCIYTPRLALIDHLIRKRKASDPPPSEELFRAYSKSNAFCVTAHPLLLVAKVSLLWKGKEIQAGAVSEGVPYRFWFPLDVLPAGEEFSIVLESTDGSRIIFKVTPKRLNKLGIR